MTVVIIVEGKETVEIVDIAHTGEDLGIDPQ